MILGLIDFTESDLGYRRLLARTSKADARGLARPASAKIFWVTKKHNLLLAKKIADERDSAFTTIVLE